MKLNLFTFLTHSQKRAVFWFFHWDFLDSHRTRDRCRVWFNACIRSTTVIPFACSTLTSMMRFESKPCCCLEFHFKRLNSSRGCRFTYIWEWYAWMTKLLFFSRIKSIFMEDLHWRFMNRLLMMFKKVSLISRAYLGSRDWIKLRITPIPRNYSREAQWSCRWVERRSNEATRE